KTPFLNIEKRAFLSLERTDFYVRGVEIPLPRTDRLAAMPLPNPFLRRAVPALSKTIFIA
ncbi:hypothetical protein OFN36_27715, partial [Escherichia coli]|nr:hypothetical protein [Escherichia coli]